MKAYYTIEVRGQDGKLLRRLKRRSRSYVRGWNDIHSAVAAVVDANLTDIDGNTKEIDASSYHLRMAGEAGNDDTGIVIGTDNTAVTISDYALGAIIVEGTGSGQMSYLANTFTTPSVVGSECSFTVTRIINNSSGATITVKEIGIYVTIRTTAPATAYVMAIRDVLATSQAVPDGGAITVVYTIKVTV